MGWDHKKSPTSDKTSHPSETGSPNSSMLKCRLHPRVATGTSEIQYDVLFVPLNGAQAKAMLDVASRLGSESRYAFLDVDRISGVQGAGEAIDTSSVESFTINQWFLTARTDRDLIVSYPRDGLIAELIAATIEAGARVGEIAPAGLAVLLVDDRPDYGHKLDRVDEHTISEWLSGATQIPSTPVRITGWNDVAEPDRDSAFLVEEYPDTLFDAEDIARFKDIHHGERCVIIGNGPSLNRLDLRKLATSTRSASTASSTPRTTWGTTSATT